jgi:type III secretion system YscQ/HrcQ family protein
MNKAPFSWVKKVASECEGLSEIPLFGNAPPFDWAHLNTLLSTSFQAEVSLKILMQEWKTPSEVKKELGVNPLVEEIHLSPLGDPVFWAMPRADVEKLTSRMLYEKGKGKTSEIVKEGFYRYLLLEALSCLSQIEPLQKLTLQLEEETTLPQENCFCISLEMQIDDKTCWALLILSPSFRKKWIEHFAETSIEYFPTEITKQIELTLGIKTAESMLTQAEWKSFEPGDFLLLDPGAYNARKETGVAILHLGMTPLFQIKIKHHKIELLDYADIYEESMEHKNDEPIENLPLLEEEIASLKHVPLTVTVELSRFKMSLDKLMHLSPGNHLELPVHPDQGVSLCINGKKVGTGELIYLGETLGVRILSIGN